MDAFFEQTLPLFFIAWGAIWQAYSSVGIDYPVPWQR